MGSFCRETRPNMATATISMLMATGRRVTKSKACGADDSAAAGGRVLIFSS